MNNSVKFFPISESAMTVEFANEISSVINDQIISLTKYLENNKFPGYIEILPAYSSLTVFYDFCVVKKNFPGFSTTFEAVKSLVEKALINFKDYSTSQPRYIEIPFSVDKQFALDLGFVAETHNLKEYEVIEFFTARTYKVFMIGFLPGFAYMGEVDQKIATPRKNSPRLQVPKGSVGIAGIQTGIYPLESPGGWQIIGKTDVELFTPNSEQPTFLRPGDLVKFHPQD